MKEGGKSKKKNGEGDEEKEDTHLKKTKK